MSGTSRGAWVLVAAAVAAAAGAGCHHGGSRRPLAKEPALVAPSEPTLGAPVEITPPGASAPGSVSWVDRHPLFSKPREYYESNPSQNRFVKGMAATVIGVPVGLFGEMKQIVVGNPGSKSY